MRLDVSGEAEDAIRHMMRIVEAEIGVESRDYVQMLENLRACLDAAGKSKEGAVIGKQIAERALRDEDRSKRLEREARQALPSG